MHSWPVPLDLLPLPTALAVYIPTARPPTGKHPQRCLHEPGLFRFPLPYPLIYGGNCDHTEGPGQKTFCARTESSKQRGTPYHPLPFNSLFPPRTQVRQGVFFQGDRLPPSLICAHLCVQLPAWGQAPERLYLDRRRHSGGTTSTSAVTASRAAEMGRVTNTDMSPWLMASARRNWPSARGPRITPTMVGATGMS